MLYQTKKIYISDLPDAIRATLPLWANYDILIAFAKREKATAYYIIVIEEDNIIALMPVFEKKKIFLKYIYQPLDYKYTPIIFYKNSNQINVLKSLATYLYKEYFRIMITLDPAINDIRAFKWSGLKAEPLYTYTKQIKDYSSDDLQKETKRILNNKAKKDLVMKKQWDLDIYKTLSIEMLNRKKRSLRQINDSYISFLNEIYAKGFITQYIAFKDENPLAYLIIIKDILQKKIYAFFAAADTNIKKNGASLFCYDFILSNYTSGFDTFDFSGANIESIAYYKSQFNPELVNYYRIRK